MLALRLTTAETSSVVARDEFRYAKSGDVAIAYAIFGEGPRDLVFVHGFAGNIEVERETLDVAPAPVSRR